MVKSIKANALEATGSPPSVGYTKGPNKEHVEDLPLFIPDSKEGSVKCERPPTELFLNSSKSIV